MRTAERLDVSHIVDGNARNATGQTPSATRVVLTSATGGVNITEGYSQLRV